MKLVRFVRRNPPLRKLSLLPLRALRLVHRMKAVPDDYQRRPPILVNSFPKSGTHLLLQIVQGLPDARYYGAFLASQPSLSFRVRSIHSQVKRIRRLAPGEALPAHLFYEVEFERSLEEMNAAVLFIYRDPRDVVVSEAMYLTHMNRWHRLHRYFSRLSTTEERISTAILGLNHTDTPFDYPDVAVRFGRYAGWLSSERALPLKYEALIGPKQQEQLQRIIDFYASFRPTGGSAPVAALQERISAERSHTYRKGGSGGWRETFTERNRAEMKQVAGRLLIDLGYENSLDW